MACNDRQLTDAQRQAGFDQQRTGVVRAIRPFSGSPTIENLIDYVNRELGPAVRQTRDKTNEVFKQVADNAPSANPLAYYFATATANADPTTGRMRLNQATQNTATVIRVSQTNGRQQDVTPWLDVMSGGPTTPLGTLTMVDAINPGRFLRFDLNTMTDQGAYWDLGVTIIESSTANPFVDEEPVVIGFIAGVSAAGSTVPVGALSPVARDTFLGNIGTTTAAPSAVPLASIDSTSIVYDATAHEMRRAALTGDVTASQNSNATTIANNAVTDAKLRDSGPMSVIGRSANSTGDPADISVVATGNVLRESGNVLGFGTVATAGIADAAITNAKLADMASPRLKGRTTAGTGVPQDLTVGNSTSITWNTSTGGAIAIERAALTGEATASANANTVTVTRSTDFDTSPWTGDHQFDANITFNNRRMLTSIATATLSSDQNNYNPTGWGTANIVRLITNDTTPRVLTGAAAGTSGELKYLLNVGNNGFNAAFVLNMEDASSSAANRWASNVGTTAMSIQTAAIIWYDGSSSRWRVVSAI